jgi:hypothetical protein
MMENQTVRKVEKKETNNTPDQLYTKYVPMCATRCVPQTHMKGKIYSCGDGHDYCKQQEGVPLCFYRRHVQTDNGFHYYFKL